MVTWSDPEGQTEVSSQFPAVDVLHELHAYPKAEPELEPEAE